MEDFSTRIDTIEKQKSLLEIEKQTWLEKALTSTDPNLIFKAQAFLGKGTEKSYIIDPQQFNSSFGFKDRPTPISYNLLRNMARTPVVNAIIRTRVNQVAAFSEPQRDKYSIGYEIRKKVSPTQQNNNNEITDIEKREIDEIIEFLENCGNSEEFDGDDFDTFIRKCVKDSLIFDQLTFEIVRNRKRNLVAFHSVDASTIRIAQNFSEHDYQTLRGENPFEKINGFYPKYVQIYQNKIKAEFYPWELCFGVRNPSSDVQLNGYGISELEELVSLITSMLWAEDYNRRFFKQGSAPKGILKVQGNMSEAKLQEFRQQWFATMRGVQNSWKTPILEADKVEWVDLQRTNRDMEFSHWFEFLIKVCCAVFSIDPAEINFPLSGGVDSKALFEGNNEARLKHSKDKGLYPILKTIQKKLNRFIISQINPKYELVFKGMDSITSKEELDMDEQAIRTYNTINEIRIKKGLKPIEGGDIIMNSTYTQQLMIIQQQQQSSQQGVDEQSVPENVEENPEEVQEAINPFEKAFNEFMSELNN